MIGKRFYALAISAILGLGCVTASFGQSANRTMVARSMHQEANSGNELATTLPYMVLMAVFLGGGIYSFVSRRPTSPRGR